MPKPSSVPSYRLHKSTGQAVVVLKGRSYYLGKFGSPKSKAEYRRVVAEYLSLGNVAPPVQGGDATPDLTVNELLLRFWTFAKGYHLVDGAPSRELDNIKDALRHLRKLYGETKASLIGPLALKATRDSMIEAGLSRKTINYRVGKIRRVFRWGAENQLVDVKVYLALKEVQGLMMGKGKAREREPVAPVGIDVVEATLPFLTAPVAAMVRLQLLSGMRPGEAMGMTAVEIEKGDEVWIYRPKRHKTAGRGKTRSIAIGPKAQEVIRPFLEGIGQGGHLFSPKSAVEARNAARRKERITPLTPSQVSRGKKAAPLRTAGEVYSRSAYRESIWRGCDRAFPHPTLASIPLAALTAEQLSELKAWRKAHRWHPNQLRHGTATNVRARYGLEAAQVVLGHAKADVTQVYAERDLAKAIEVMREMG